LAKNNKDIANAYDIPQDSQLSPRSGLLESIRDKIYATEPGRRLMDATDAFNKITGGPDLGNVGGGASHAVTPALEKLVNEGLIRRGTSLLEQTRNELPAFFSDAEGTIYNLGALSHPYILQESGLMPRGLEDVHQGIRDALDKANLMRIRNITKEFSSVPVTAAEMTKMPSDIQMSQLADAFEKYKNIAIDMGNRGKQLKQTFEDPETAINAIYKFFGK
jgi:hypothetical protein